MLRLGHAIVGTLLVAGCGRTPGDGRPNVVLISIDSLRADHVGCYGYPRPTSPAIDALAARGTVFRNAVSSTSWTLPSHASLFTGLPDSVHGVDRSSRALADGRLTLAERLREEGYRTAGFWSGPYLHPAFGLSQGFDEYMSCAAFDYFSAEEETFRGGAPRDQGQANRLSHEDVTSPRVLEATTSWLDRLPPDGRPFFLFAHFWDVHYDYIPPPPYDTLFDPDYTGSVDGRGLGDEREVLQGLSPRDLEHLQALYDGEIAWTDHHVGLLLDRVRELPGRTVVVLVADHGEEFFEHGRFGHRKTLYEESIRVPLVVEAPGAFPPGLEVRAPVSLLDVAPTILDLVGAAPLPETYGRSLLPLVRGEPGREGVTVSELRYLRREERLVAIRTRRWKLLVDGDTGQTLSAFDLSEDPDELRDLVATGSPIPQPLEAVRGDTLAVLADLARRHGEATVDSRPTEGLTDELRKLGYLGEDEE